ncbi:endolytic transglycosylase MltG [Patescibacteria group bacterium]|nr:endolytic transglycosylase MltG [Patescibacteria group bacterium]
MDWINNIIDEIGSFVTRRRAASICLAVVILLVAIFVFGVSAPSKDRRQAQFTVNPNESTAQIGNDLQKYGFIRSSLAFYALFPFSGKSQFQPGGYYLSPSMNLFGIISALSAAHPPLAWVTIPPGLRKEQIGDLLKTALDWTSSEESGFIATDTTINWTVNPPTPDKDYFEGVYLPDTYLIPATSTPAQVAARLQDHFEEVFAPYAKEAAAQNIKWTTVLKVASIIQREASGAQDMGIISGIIWNRLADRMYLDIDSTVQYARGNTGAGWWAPIKPADEKIDSPYNTYLHTGLPPAPIAEPSLAAIEAAIYPATTTCLYYIHDSSGQIHCSPTYQGQLENIKKYL